MAGPFIDPSLITLDPMLASTFSVVSRVEVVNAYGESTTVNKQANGIIGVITATSPADLQRLDDNERGARNYTVITRYRLNSAANSLQPDLILFQNDTFIVRMLMPYTAFGAGWVKAIVASIDSVEAKT